LQIDHLLFVLVEEVLKRCWWDIIVHLNFNLDNTHSPLTFRGLSAAHDIISQNPLFDHTYIISYILSECISVSKIVPRLTAEKIPGLFGAFMLSVNEK
jgi:hypothetical protein